MEPTTQKTNILNALIIVLVVAVIGFVGYGLLNKDETQPQPIVNNNQNTEPVVDQNGINGTYNPNNPEPTNPLNPFVSVGTAFSGGKKYSDPGLNFSFEFPKDWVLDRQDYASTSDLIRMITLTKQGYHVVLTIRKSADITKVEDSTMQKINVANVESKPVLRYDQAFFDDSHGSKGYYPLFANNEYGYSRYMKFDDKNFYSVTYELPSIKKAGDAVDAVILGEADKIVGTFKVQ